MGKRGAVAAGIALIAGVLAGCSAPAPTVTPTIEAASTPTQVSALEQLRQDYTAAGGQCATITPRNMAVADEAGDCDGGALLSTYTSTSGRDAAINTLEGSRAIGDLPGYVIAVGDDWIVNGRDAELVAARMGGTTEQIGPPTPHTTADLTTDAGICEADAELTNLELNDVLAPALGFPREREARTHEQDDAIRAYKNAAFERACPARAG